MILTNLKGKRRSVRRSGWVVLPLLIVAGSQAGCAPNIRNFTISPQTLCEGESALIRWDASGDIDLTVSPEPPPPSSSMCAIRGRATSNYTLIARRNGKERRAAIEVIQLDDQGTEPVGFPTSAIVELDVLARGNKDPHLWSDSVRIVTVAACEGRTITVKHADRVASLPSSGAPSSAFDGTVLAGPWEMLSPLSSAERTDRVLRPTHLEILATFRCQKGTP
jgi:hypothetical protein